MVREDVVLSHVFEKMDQDREKLQIVDWGITETTLEEVFLKLALLSHNDLTGVARSLSDLARHGLNMKMPDAKTSSSALAVADEAKTAEKEMGEAV